MTSSLLKILSVSEAITWLKAGNILIHPTETCYGLAVDATQGDAMDQLFAFKKRDAHKPVSLLLGSAQQFSELAELSPLAQKIITQFLPGPLTLVLPLKEEAQKRLDPRVHGDTNWVGLRLSGCTLTQELVQQYGRPLTTTSANLSGEPEIYDFETLCQKLTHAKVATLGDKTLAKNLPSTVIKVDGDRLECLREGMIGFDEIRRVLQNRFC